MSDLQCVEYAVQCVLAECRKENPHRMSTPADGETVMLRFAAALNEAKEIRDGDGESAPQPAESDPPIPGHPYIQTR